jgi:hypothetical protein
LKDYAATPQYKGVGFFLVTFGVGLISALLYYISLAFSRATALNAVMDEAEVNEAWQAFLSWINVPTLVISILALLIAIVALMFRFASLLWEAACSSRERRCAAVPAAYWTASNIR